MRKKGCPHCGKVPYPARNEDGSWNWKNILRIEWLTVLLVVGLLMMAYGYTKDTEVCRDFESDPCSYCEQVEESCMVQAAKEQLIPRLKLIEDG